MSLGTVTIQVSPQTAEVLRQLETQAKARQVPLDVYLHSLAERKNGAAHAMLSPQDKARQWQEWAASHDPNTPVILDDNREAIYASEDEVTPPLVGLTPQEKANRWMEFVAAYSVNVPFPVDDSRASIYTREDEAL